MRLSPLSQVRSVITGKNRFPVTIRQITGCPRINWHLRNRSSRIQRCRGGAGGFSLAGVEPPARRATQVDPVMVLRSE
jgi:hypothetical protein